MVSKKDGFPPSDFSFWFLRDPNSAELYKKPRIFCETCGKDVEKTLHAIPLDHGRGIQLMVECHGERATVDRMFSDLQETLLVFPRQRKFKLKEGNPEDLKFESNKLLESTWNSKLVHLPCHCFQDETRVCPQGKTGPGRQCQIVVEELTLLEVMHDFIHNRFKQTQEKNTDKVLKDTLERGIGVSKDGKHVPLSEFFKTPGEDK